MKDYNFFEKYQILYSMQFGFRTNYSTEHVLVSLTEKISQLFMAIVLVVAYLSV